MVIGARINEIIYSMEKQGADQEQIDQELTDRNFDPDQANLETLPRAAGAEVGGRLAIGSRILVSFAGWYLHMEEELVFIGDEGTTEISGETRRLGLDLEVRLQIANFLNVDWNEAQFDTESRLYNEITPVSELHFTPGNPFNVQLGISYEF